VVVVQVAALPRPGRGRPSAEGRRWLLRATEHR
jgi:hypothetical protein